MEEILLVAVCGAIGALLFTAIEKFNNRHK